MTAISKFSLGSIATGPSRLGFASVAFVLGMSSASSVLAQAPKARSANPPRSRVIGQAPGLESFAVQPQTPDELIKAIDYLVRVGLENQAVPLANKLAAIESDDESLDALRQSIGSSKLLALQSTGDPNLNAAMSRFVDKLNAAARTVALDPERARKLIDQLSATPEEREIAIESLARLGSSTVDEFVRELSDPNLAADKRNALQQALNRMESSAVPGLVGALRHPDKAVRASVVEALGQIGDSRALPWVVFEANRPQGAGAAASNAVADLNDGKFVDDPARFLLSEAGRYLDRDVFFGDPEVEAWFWDERDKSMKSLTMPADSARGAIGYRLAKMAMELDPQSEAAHALIVSILIDEETRRLGSEFPEKDPLGAWPMALASGPRTLGYVLKRAMLTGRHENVAVLATRALGQTLRESDLVSGNGRPHILVEALDSPDRRVQFEAAKALLKLAPSKAFPGSSRVVPTMARFLRSNPYAPRAVVINDHVGKGSDWVSYTKSMGYDAILETSSSDAFEEIAIRGDVELILLSTFLDPAGWALHETVANLKADSRTSGIPLIVVGPLDARSRLSTLLGGSHQVGFMVEPADENWAKRQIESQLARLPHEGLSADERRDYSVEAGTLLGKSAAAGDASIFAQAIQSLDTVAANRLNVPEGHSENPISESDRNMLIGTVLQESASESDRILSAERLAEGIRKSIFFLDSGERDRLFETFLKLENGKAQELAAAIGRLVGSNEPGTSDISKFFERFSPGANFYDSVRENSSAMDTP
jgi:HEAT repeat protein